MSMTLGEFRAATRFCEDGVLLFVAADPVAPVMPAEAVGFEEVPEGGATMAVLLVKAAAPGDGAGDGSGTTSPVGLRSAAPMAPKDPA